MGNLSWNQRVGKKSILWTALDEAQFEEGLSGLPTEDGPIDENQEESFEEISVARLPGMQARDLPCHSLTLLYIYSKHSD
jgi:hypothetical protein